MLATIPKQNGWHVRNCAKVGLSNGQKNVLKHNQLQWQKATLHCFIAETRIEHFFITRIPSFSVLAINLLYLLIYLIADI